MRKKNSLSAVAAVAGLSVVLLGIAGCSSLAAQPGQPAVSATKPAGQATVTGYVSSPVTGTATGPVSVVLQGASAARLDQLVAGLQKTVPPACAENAVLYKIVFTTQTGNKPGFAVTGYQCGGHVLVTSGGTIVARTDRGCVLLTAVRRVLPASAKATQRLTAPCAS
jgi:hypothetical protein